LIESILKDTGKDALRYVPAKAVPAMVNFIGLLVFTHIFSAEDYGNYFIVLATISVMSIIGSNWVTNSVIRFYPEFNLRQDLDRFFTNVIFAFIICNLVIVSLYVFGFFLLKNRIPPALIPFLNLSFFAYLSSATYFVFLFFLRASLQATAFSIYEIISSVGKFVVALVLAFFFKIGAISLLWGMLLMSVLLSVSISKRFSIVRRVKAELFSKEICKGFFKYGSPLAISSLSAWLLVLSDRYMLQFLATAEDVGIYSVSFSAVDRSIGMLYSVLMLAAFPIIVSTWEEKGKEMTQQLIKELSRYFFILCIPAFVGLSILSKDIFTLFIGENFVESFKLVPLFAFCSLLMGLFQYVGKGFEIHKRTLLLALTFLISGLANVGLNILLIPIHGYMGAGIAKAVSYLLLLIVGIKIVHPIMAWRAPLASLSKIVFSAVFMGVLLVFLKRFLSTSLINLAFLMALGTCTYFVLLLLSHEVKKSEMDFMKSYYHKLIGSRTP
jgi:O-antigen/teichoic acid export membrane protein